MEAISKPELDKSRLRVPADVKRVLRSGELGTYDVLQLMGNTVNASADEVNRATDWVNRNGEILAANEEERIENEKEREAAEELRQQTFEAKQTERQEAFEEAEADRNRSFEAKQTERQEAFEEAEGSRKLAEDARAAAEESRVEEFGTLKEKTQEALDVAISAAENIDMILNGSDDKDKAYPLMVTHYALKHVDGEPVNEFVAEFRERDGLFLTRHVSLEANMRVSVTATGGSGVKVIVYRVFDQEGEVAQGANIISTGTRVLKLDEADGTLDFVAAIKGNYVFTTSDSEEYLIWPTESDVDVPVEHRPAAQLYVTDGGLIGLQESVFRMNDKLDKEVDRVERVMDGKVNEVDQKIGDAIETVNTALAETETRVNDKMKETLDAVNERADEVIAKAVRTSTTESVEDIL